MKFAGYGQLPQDEWPELRSNTTLFGNNSSMLMTLGSPRVYVSWRRLINSLLQYVLLPGCTVTIGEWMVTWWLAGGQSKTIHGDSMVTVVLDLPLVFRTHLWSEGELARFQEPAGIQHLRGFASRANGSLTIERIAEMGGLEVTSHHPRRLKNFGRHRQPRRMRQLQNFRVGSDRSIDLKWEVAF